MGIFDNFINKRVDAAMREQLAVIENENNFLIGTRSLTQTERDRYSYDRTSVLEQSLTAWRANPLARRIVELTSQYVVGGGLTINCKDKPAADFLDQFWNHRLNRMPVRVSEICDELTRTGNLFIILTTDTAGMSYLRLMPATAIDEIISKDNDVEQPVLFKLKADIENLDPTPIPAYDPLNDEPTKTVILQYAVNRPSGAQWGEPDIAPLLVWLSRYSNWLQDRARLNRFRNAFLFVVQAKFASEAQRVSRQTTLNANPPNPGSILVADENESWKVINPRLDSSNAEKDGLALKKMIAAGAGIPLHFLAEPESATRTTADAAGGPTFRRFEQRQQFFIWMIEDILRVVISRRAMIDSKLNKNIELSVTGADISSKDNTSLSQAAYYMVEVLANLRDRSLIANDEFLRLIYRFFGETVDADDMLTRAQKDQDKKQGKDLDPKTKTTGNPSAKVINPPDDGVILDPKDMTK
ncbi:MAG: hypothetical protein Q7J07_07760 [Pelolinea sp.]|nr:hypothetical protein [Pelolinea sp.]